MKPQTQQHIQQIQEIAGRNDVSFGAGAGAGFYAYLNEAATIAEQVGMICGGILSVLILGNWLYVHFFKKNKTKK